MSHPLVDKLLGTAALAFFLWYMLPAGFLTSPFLLSHDTSTYTNKPGIASGISLNNFSDGLRTPGYPLFFFAVTLGEIPHPDTITFAYCGGDLLSRGGDCDIAANSLHADVTVRAPPVVYGFSQRTSDLFQRTILASRALFLLSLLALCLCLTSRIGLLAPFCLAGVFHFMRLGEAQLLDVLATESLFPTVLFFYVAALLQYVKSRRGGWLLASSLLALYIPLVRPAYIYVPILHLAVAALFALSWKAWRSLAPTLLLTVATFAWWAWWSPIDFFSVANFESELLRTAVISDQATVDCVADPAAKTLLAAYLHSIAGDTSAKKSDGDAQYYVQRYFDLGVVGAYRIDDKQHPIYQEPGIDRLLDKGVISTALVSGMISAAKSCNIFRNAEYTAINVAMMVGVTPVLTPHAPHYFFRRPMYFFVSFGFLCAGVWVGVKRRNAWWLCAILVPAALYFGMILIIALKQGGEARYSHVVEPLFVLSAMLALLYAWTTWRVGQDGNRRRHGMLDTGEQRRRTAGLRRR